MARYWVGGGSSSNWDATTPTNWGTASNTQDDASVPSATDDVIFNGVGTGASNSTLSANIEIKSFTGVGYANTLTHNASVTLTINGNGGTVMDIGATTLYAKGSLTTSIVKFTSTSGTSDVNTRFSAFPTVIMDGVGGTLRFANHGYFTHFQLVNGTFSTNNFNPVIGTLESSNANVRSIILGTSTITMDGVGDIWDTSTTTNLTFTPNTSVIQVTNNTVTLKTFKGGGLTFSTVNFGGDNVVLTGDNTFNVFGLSNAECTIGLKITSGSTQTFTSMVGSGGGGDVAILLSTTAGVPHTLVCAQGASIDYTSIKDSTATGVSVFYAGANSTNVSGNTGWVFAAPSAGRRNSMMMGVG